MSRYQAYAEYKDSGVEWLGDVPAHWSVSKVKYLTEFQVGWTPPTKDDANFEGDNLWANISDLRGREIFDTNKKISDHAAKVASMEISPRGSLLYSFKLSVGAVSFAGNDMYTNEAIATFLPTSKLPLAYLYYVLPKYLIENASTNIYGARILNQELISNADLLSPTFSEAENIANFLDHETAKIDLLIEKQQGLIALLKEKRQAVISHAVTKGLNPNAPMKDSGVEWLGEVPEHWVIAKLSFRYEVLLGKMLDDKKITGDYLAPYLRNTDVQWDRINTDELPMMDFRPEEAERYSVQKGDLIVCEGGEIGRSAIWENDDPCFYQKALHRLRPINKVADRSRFMFYQLFNAVHQERFISAAGKSTIAHLPAETFRQYKFAFPPNDEQEAIECYLNQQKNKFELLEQKAEQQIKLFQERRTALISAAVTGKIDVRDWQA